MADIVNILNTILAQGSELYSSRVPEATKTNITEVGSAIMSHKETRNEFLDALVNKVAMSIVHNRTFRNPLSILKKGGVPLGKNVEEIYTNPATGTIYDPSGKDLLNRAIPETFAIYHTLNRQGKYKVTITRAQLMQAFTSINALEQLLVSISNTIYSGDNLDEFMLMKELFSSGIAGGKIKTCEVGSTSTEEGAKAFVKAVKATGNAMSFPSSTFNSYHDVNAEQDSREAIVWTPLENQILIIRGDVAVDVDVELLARAFNVSYTEMKQRTLTVDNFGTNSRCGAVLCDENLVQVRDALYETEIFRNPEGLYDNYYLHHWQSYSLSLFANAMAFMLPE